MAVRTIFLICLFTAASISAGTSQGHTYALMANGISKDPSDRAVKARVLGELRTYLLDTAGVDPNRLTVLAPGASSTQRMAEAMSAYASVIGQRDRFVFYYIGQANCVAESLRFNVVGPDITDQQVTLWLNRIKADSQLVVLDCPCAAVAAKKMARPGRVLLLASTAEQVYSTRFSLHFLPALHDPNNDADADGRVSVLEAFAATARDIEQWYRDAKILATETPSLEDNGDGAPSEQPWRYTLDGGDGAAASRFFLVK